MKIVFGGIVVPAAVDPVADTHLIGEIFSCFGIDVAGKLVWFSTGRTGKTAVFPVVRFQYISFIDSLTNLSVRYKKKKDVI